MIVCVCVHAHTSVWHVVMNALKDSEVMNIIEKFTAITLLEQYNS